MEVGTTVKKVL